MINYTEEQTFTQTDFTEEGFPKGEFENCIFNSCNFLEADLSGSNFIDCEFDHCNLSMSQVKNTAFRMVHFKNCKMLGLRFDECNHFGLSVQFSNCLLQHASFYKTPLKKSFFNQCELIECDFTEALLNEAKFQSCDFSGATFEATNLQKADFRTSKNFSINPTLNSIKAAKFSKENIEGLLHYFQIEIE